MQNGTEPPGTLWRPGGRSRGAAHLLCLLLLRLLGRRRAPAALRRGRLLLLLMLLLLLLLWWRLWGSCPGGRHVPAPASRRQAAVEGPTQTI